MVNKMFIMLPVMLAARKLDGENPLVVYWLRIAYGCVQFLSVCVVLYVYWRASQVKADRTVYVPPAPVVRFSPQPQLRKPILRFLVCSHYSP